MKKAALFLLILLGPVVCRAKTYYVNAELGSDFAFDGTSPTPDPGLPGRRPGPKATIQAGIDLASDGDTVIVAQGTYTGDGNRDIDFKGKAITARSTDPNDPNVVSATVIDGEQDFTDCLLWSPGLCGCEIHRGFVFHSGEGPNSVLAGVTITRFSAPDELIWDEPMPAGGGIFCENSSPTISRCVITDNWAHHLGAGGFGGNISCKGACSPTITHCTISKGVSYFGAGGIYCPGGNPTITHCIITDNYAVFGVGGADCGSGATISHCLISNNSGGSGGIEGSPTISNCVITHNRAEWQGGGISGSPRIDHCIVSNNVTSPGLGGGIYLTSGGAVIKNCTISGNLAASGYMMGEWWTDGEGGGIFCWEGNPTIIQCTIADNTAGARGGGIYGNPSIANCILWDNMAPDEPEISGDPNISFTDVEGGWPGAGNINDDPCFADRDANDFHLKSQAGRWDAKEGRWAIDEVTSPCIDAGDPMWPIGYEPFPNGGIINMGAYGGTAEASKSYFGGPPCEITVAGDINGDCIVDFRDLCLMAVHWLEGR